MDTHPAKNLKLKEVNVRPPSGPSDGRRPPHPPLDINKDVADEDGPHPPSHTVPPSPDITQEPAENKLKQKDAIPGAPSGSCDDSTPPTPPLDTPKDVVDAKGPPPPLPNDPPVMPQTPGTGEMSGGDVQTDGQILTECVHVKGGVCLTHGKGAKKKWKPKWVTILNEFGVSRRVYKRQTYYECDLKPGTVDKMTQPKLVFSKMTTDRDMRSDTAQGDNGSTMTSTEGQNVDIVSANGK